MTAALKAKFPAIYKYYLQRFQNLYKWGLDNEKTREKNGIKSEQIHIISAALKAVCQNKLQFASSVQLYIYLLSRNMWMLPTGKRSLPLEHQLFLLLTHSECSLSTHWASLVHRNIYVYIYSGISQNKMFIFSWFKKKPHTTTAVSAISMVWARVNTGKLSLAHLFSTACNSSLSKWQVILFIFYHHTTKLC